MDNNISSFVSNPIEPDLSAAMVQGIVNPAELVNTQEEGDFRVLPHTLVFTRSLANHSAETVSGLPQAKRSKIEPAKYPHVVGGGVTEEVPLFILGVAYDGIPDAAAAKHWPNERGRLVVQVCGTCTLILRKSDLDQLDILDSLQIDRTKDFSANVASVEDYNLPHVCAFNVSQNQERLKAIKKIGEYFKKNDTAKKNTVLIQIIDALKKIKCEKINFSNFNSVDFKEKIDTNDFNSDSVDEKKMKYLKKMLEQDSKPFGVLLEKGFESARILLTP